MLANHKRTFKSIGLAVFPHVAIVPYTLYSAKNELICDNLGLHSKLYEALVRGLQIAIGVLASRIVCQSLPVCLNRDAIQVVTVWRSPEMSDHDFINVFELQMVIPGGQVQPYKPR